MSWEADGRFVKICGLRTAADLEVSVEAGADAVGFVWYPPSPRHLELDEIRDLAFDTPILTVLVTAGVDSGALVDAAARAGVGAVQPHGPRSAVAAAAARHLGLRVIHPVSAGDDVAHVPEGDLLLIDAPDPNMVGGSGEVFDWDLVATVARPFVLAGGLGPDNVGEAIRRVQPFGVDASSGLESSPGVKSPDLIRRFVQEAKRA